MPARRRPTAPPTGRTVIQLRIQLRDVHPVVWRRLLLPGNAHLDKVHAIFQAAMGWENAHLHKFAIGDQVYGPADEDADEDELDETAVDLASALGSQRRFTYEYDFGDGWDHDVVVEGTSAAPASLKFAVCLEGENACPPEDCGGPGGYAALLESLADPDAGDHADIVRWLGKDFDPFAFSVADTNVALQLVR